MAIIKAAPKHSLEFLNGDDSQILSERHRVEHRSFLMTRDACMSVGAKVERLHTDAHGQVDFRIDGICRTQDKVCSNTFQMRQEGQHPYDPNSVDVLQLSDLDHQVVYAFPMRKLTGNEVTSSFSIAELMHTSVTMTGAWKQRNAGFMHDLKTREGVLKFMTVCRNASKLPVLSDGNFYSELLTTNTSRFQEEKKTQATSCKQV